MNNTYIVVLYIAIEKMKKDLKISYEIERYQTSFYC
jgi:hypothetical protein